MKINSIKLNHQQHISTKAKAKTIKNNNNFIQRNEFSPAYASNLVFHGLIPHINKAPNKPENVLSGYNRLITDYPVVLETDKYTEVLPGTSLFIKEKFIGQIDELLKQTPNKDGSYTIGRVGKGSDIQINRPYVSTKQATIIRQNGRYFIKDENSTNGTTAITRTSQTTSSNTYKKISLNELIQIDNKYFTVKELLSRFSKIEDSIYMLSKDDMGNFVLNSRNCRSKYTPCYEIASNNRQLYLRDLRSKKLSHSDFIENLMQNFGYYLSSKGDWAYSQPCGKNAISWKIHVFSDNEADYQKLAKTVLPYLAGHKIGHKTLPPKTPAEELGRYSQQKGKVITVYPNSIEETAKIMKDLEEIISSNGLSVQNSHIIGDKKIGETGRLFYRYEAATKYLAQVEMPKSVWFEAREKAWFGKYLYESNRGDNKHGGYLPNSMTADNDPFKDFNPANPNSKIKTTDIIAINSLEELEAWFAFCAQKSFLGIQPAKSKKNFEKFKQNSLK